MEAWLEYVLSMSTALLASGGLWTWLQNRRDRSSTTNKMILGLAQDRIVHLGTKYIRRGSITSDEYGSFMQYLYEPYIAMNGNGLAKKIQQDVSKLPIIEEDQFLRMETK